MEEIHRDPIQDCIGTVLWWLVAILWIVGGVIIQHVVICTVVGLLIAYGLYYVITGRTD